MKKLAIPKEMMLKVMEPEVKKQVEHACKMMPEEIVVEKLEWTEAGITVWLKQ